MALLFTPLTIVGTGQTTNQKQPKIRGDSALGFSVFTGYDTPSANDILRSHVSLTFLTFVGSFIHSLDNGSIIGDTYIDIRKLL